MKEMILTPAFNFGFGHVIWFGHQDVSMETSCKNLKWAGRAGVTILCLSVIIHRKCAV